MTRPVRTIATLAVGIAVYVGLPLIAWGPSDLRGFAHEPARAAYVLIASALCAYAAVRIPEIGKPREQAVARVPRQRRAVLLLQVLSLALMIVAPYDDRHGGRVFADTMSIRAAGVVLFTVGFLLMHRAEAVLGRQFSLEVEIQREHRLITTGLYSRVRHPRYLGILAFTCGVALVFRSAAGLALDGGILAVLLWRIHDEEALMRQEFGAEWDRYTSRTWRMIPLLF